MVKRKKVTESLVERYLVVGLGNPGKLYEKTRHNIGFEVVKAFAEKYNLKFKKEEKFQGKIAQGSVFDNKLYLLMPLCFMNVSGRAVRLCIDFFKIDISKILIICDDVDLPFGQMRLKMDSSTGGHKGLASVEDQLKTQSYPRLRIGVGRGENLISFVLGRFSCQERTFIPPLIEQAVGIIELWLKEGIVRAMNVANVRKGKKIEER